MRHSKTVHLALALVVGGLSGCGGDEGFKINNDAGGSPSTGGDTSQPTVSPALGVVVDGVFIADEIEVGLSPLAAGGSTGLRVNIVDTASGNAPYTDPVTVRFSSPCATGGQDALAIIDPVEVVTSTGTAGATYRAQGCEGTETIRATAVVAGTSQTATSTIEVLRSELGSIQFVSSVPELIGIRGSGSGLPETAIVTFRVLNATGGAIQNQTVQFSLNSAVGGIELKPADGITKTDGNGLVSVSVRSGTVHTAVRLTATAEREGVSISSQSSALAISTGLPDQNSFSLSAECFNVEALQYDGEDVAITIRAADRFNNPAPDGTVVAFTTEGGAIDGVCSTTDGACSVTWTSQDPRPRAFCDQTANNGVPDCDDDLQSAFGLRAGRSTILASALGEESFVDADGDGRFDIGETFVDLPEAFRDDDEDGRRDEGTDAVSLVEEFLDFNQNGLYDHSPANQKFGDGRFNGVLCDPDAAGNACNPNSLHVRESLTIIMSGSAPYLREEDINSAVYDSASSQFNLDSGETASVLFTMRDINLQPLPAGTTIQLSADGDVSIVGSSSWSVPCLTDDTASANTYPFAIRGAKIDAGDPDGTALLELKVTSPKGVVTVFSFLALVAAPAAQP